jgi:hypothetical protein
MGSGTPLTRPGHVPVATRYVINECTGMDGYLYRTRTLP